MKTIQLVSILAATMLSHFTIASVHDDAILESISDEIQQTCRNEDQADECFALIKNLRADPDYRHLQLQIAQLLIIVSGAHPEVLDISYDILTDLAKTHPENSDYLGMRAFVRYRQDPIAGIWEAKENNVPGMLSMILKAYLKSGSIQRDIIVFKIEEFKLSLERGESMRLILSNASLALESIVEFGNDTEAKAFISDARDLIPWVAWREGDWAEIASKREFSPELARDVIYIYCQRMMLQLDEGKFCADATTLIHETATVEVLSDADFKQMARSMKSTVKLLQPLKIGNGLQLLEQLAGAEQ